VQNAAMEACGSMNDLTQSGMQKPDVGAQATDMMTPQSVEKGDKTARSHKRKRTSKKVEALTSSDEDEEEEEGMGQIAMGQMTGGTSNDVSSQFGDIMQHVMQNSPLVKAKMDDCKKRTNELGDVNKQYNNKMVKVNEYQSNLTKATDLVESLQAKYEGAQMLAVQSCPMLNGADTQKIKAQLRKLTAKVVKAAQLAAPPAGPLDGDASALLEASPAPTATTLPSLPTSTAPLAPVVPAATAPADPMVAAMPVDPAVDSAAMQAKMEQCQTNTKAINKVTNELADAQRMQQNQQALLDSKSQEIQTTQAEIEAAQNAATEACAAIGGATAKTVAKKSWDKTMKATQFGVEAPAMAAPSAVSPVVAAPTVDPAAMQLKMKDCKDKTGALSRLQKLLQEKQGYQAKFESGVQQAISQVEVLAKQQADAQELASTSCAMNGPMRARTGLAKLRLSATRRR